MDCEMLTCNGHLNIPRDVVENMRKGVPVVRLQQLQACTLALSSSSNKLPKIGKGFRQASLRNTSAQNRAPRTTKKHCCVFCQILVTKLPRHLEIKHHTEHDVQEALKFEKGSLARKRAWLNIQKLGDFEYLQSQINTNRENKTIIPLRRLQHKKNPSLEEYAVCPKCKGIFTRKNLKNHVRETCDPKKRTSRRTILPNSRLLTLSIHPKANDLVKKHIFSILRDDVVVRAISNDELVVTYANYASLKFRSSLHHYKMVRHEVRHLGDLFLRAKSLNKLITDLTAMFDPKYFDDVVRTIQMDAGFDAEIGKYRRPTRASSSCALIQKVGEVAVTNSIRNERPDLQVRQENFLQLLKTLKNTLINRTAIENLTQNRRQKKVSMPKTDMVWKFFNYINAEIYKCYSSLSKTYDEAKWIKLSKLVLVHIMLFNRRRPGEIERAFICDYLNLDNVDEEFIETLAKDERRYATRFCRFVIRGKLNRPVPVILHVTIKKSLDLILHYRGELGISPENQYLFAKPSESQQTYFQAYLALKQFLAEGNFPTDCRITATNLRKHLATVVAGLHIDDNKLTDVVDFMGHHINIHKRIYRQMPVARDVINMGQILMTASGNRADDKDPFSEVSVGSDSSQGNTVCHSPGNNLSVPVLEDVNNANFDNFSAEHFGDTEQRLRTPWSDEQNEACKKYFTDFFETGVYPSAGRIRYVCSQITSLRGQTPRKVKAHLQHLKFGNTTKSRSSKARKNLEF